MAEARPIDKTQVLEYIYENAAKRLAKAEIYNGTYEGDQLYYSLSVLHEIACKIEGFQVLEGYAPVKHSEWVKAGGFTVCKECGCSPADWEAKPDNPSGLPPFCHSCGAKMDGAEA